jgi:amino acid permease
VSTNFKFRPLTAVCLALAIAFVIIGIVYFTSTASALPSFLPGHQAGSAHHHTKHGIAMIGLAVLAVIGAWFTTAPGARSSQRG